VSTRSRLGVTAAIGASLAFSGCVYLLPGSLRPSQSLELRVQGERCFLKVSDSIEAGRTQVNLEGGSIHCIVHSGDTILEFLPLHLSPTDSGTLILRLGLEAPGAGSGRITSYFKAPIFGINASVSGETRIQIGSGPNLVQLVNGVVLAKVRPYWQGS
jgi:hypothetical protein